MCECVGRSRAVCGLLSHIRVETDVSSASDVLRMHITSLLDAVDAHFKDVERVAICSSVPSLAVVFQDVCKEHLDNAHVVLVGSVHGARDACCYAGDAVCKFAGDVEYQGKVGADRIANSVAAHDIYGCAAVVVVDFGTAVNFDVVSHAGVFIGGAIFPGLATSFEALVGKAAGLNSADLFNLENLSLENAFDAFGGRSAACNECSTVCSEHSTDVPVIGKNTAESIASGALHGFASMVDGMVYRLTEVLHRNTTHETRTATSTVQVVATGGYAHLIAAISNSIQHVEPFLTCHGCRVIANAV